MPATSLRRHARTLIVLNPSPPRLLIAVKAAAAMAIPLALAQTVGRLPLGLLASLGVFTILYAGSTPGRFRARLMAWVGAGLVLCATLGSLAGGHLVAGLVVLLGVCLVSVVTCQALKVGPPGAYFFPLVTGVAGLASSHGTTTLAVALSAAGGAAIAWCVGMGDLLRDPHGPERRAVDAAQQAVAALVEADPDHLVPARAAASRALHHAWTAVTDGGSDRTLVTRLQHVQDRYAQVLARLAHDRLAGRAAGPASPRPTDGDDGPGAHGPVAGGDVPDGGLSGGDPEPWGSVDDEAASRDAGRPSGPDPVREREQLRDTALGRPRAEYLVRQSVQVPSEVWLVVRRVMLAVTLAGVLAAATSRGHAYWVVATAMLVLHQGGTRDAQTVRGLHRAVGTVVGLLVFAAVQQLHPSGWGVVALVTVLQLVVEVLVTRNYALAVVAITPLALTIATVSAPGAVGSTVADRLVDTLVGVGCALLVLWTTGRRHPERQLRAHGRRVVVAVERVLVDLAAGALGTRAALDHRRHLYYELLESDAVARRAAADHPREVEPYRRLEQQMSALGYVVLGACWHPDLRRSHEAFEAAREPLERILADPVTTPRPAEELARDVRAVEAVVSRLGSP